MRQRVEDYIKYKFKIFKMLCNFNYHGIYTKTFGLHSGFFNIPFVHLFMTFESKAIINSNESPTFK